MSNLPKRLRGVVPPMVTPLTGRDTIDAAGLERLVDHIVAGGVAGLFILGTTGEGPSLSYHLRRELVERVCQQVDGRVPVLVGITDTSFIESVNLAEEAADAGAQAVVLAAPYYFPAGQAELIEYVEHIVEELPLPVFLYNMPSLTKVMFEPDTVRRAMDLPGVVGIKDSSANMIYFHRILELARRREDFSVLVGPEELLAESVLLGADGGVHGGANVRPRLYVDLYEAAARGDLAKTAELHRQVMRAATSLYGVGRHSSAVIKGIKCALSILGICDDFMAEPFHRFREEERQQIRTHLENLGIIPAPPASAGR